MNGQAPTVAAATFSAPTFSAPTISAEELFARLGNAAAPVVVDVRKHDVFGADDRLIVSALRCDIDANPGWPSALPAGRPIVVYCAHGAEVSRTAAAKLKQAGIDAAYLDGGIASWRVQNLPARKSARRLTNGSRARGRR